jgi:hypothetical protein
LPSAVLSLIALSFTAVIVQPDHPLAWSSFQDAPLGGA